MECGKFMGITQFQSLQKNDVSPVTHGQNVPNEEPDEEQEHPSIYEPSPIEPFVRQAFVNHGNRCESKICGHKITHANSSKHIVNCMMGIPSENKYCLLTVLKQSKCSYSTWMGSYLEKM